MMNSGFARQCAVSSRPREFPYDPSIQSASIPDSNGRTSAKFFRSLPAGPQRAGRSQAWDSRIDPPDSPREGHTEDAGDIGRAIGATSGGVAGGRGQQADREGKVGLLPFCAWEASEEINSGSDCRPSGATTRVQRCEAMQIAVARPHLGPNAPHDRHALRSLCFARERQSRPA